MCTRKDGITTESTENKPLRGQMDIFSFIETPRGYVANERSIKKRRSTVPGQINMFEYMDQLDLEACRQEQAAKQQSEEEMLPGQMDIMDFLVQEETPVTERSPLIVETLSAEENFTQEDSIPEEDLLVLGEGSVNIGRIMRVLHISAVEAQRMQERLVQR